MKHKKRAGARAGTARASPRGLRVGSHRPRRRGGVERSRGGERLHGGGLKKERQRSRLPVCAVRTPYTAVRRAPRGHKAAAGAAPGALAQRTVESARPSAEAAAEAGAGAGRASALHRAGCRPAQLRRRLPAARRAGAAGAKAGIAASGEAERCEATGGGLRQPRHGRGRAVCRRRRGVHALDSFGRATEVARLYRRDRGSWQALTLSVLPRKVSVCAVLAFDDDGRRRAAALPTQRRRRPAGRVPDAGIARKQRMIQVSHHRATSASTSASAYRQNHSRGTACIHAAMCRLPERSMRPPSRSRDAPPALSPGSGDSARSALDAAAKADMLPLCGEACGVRRVARGCAAAARGGGTTTTAASPAAHTSCAAAVAVAAGLESSPRSTSSRGSTCAGAAPSPSSKLGSRSLPSSSSSSVSYTGNS